jgi:dTDP-4-dehydrorhamnose 3,5-epimerase
MLVDLRERRDPPAVATVDLTADEPRVLYIPPGIAHGFLAITDLDLIYWVSNYYDSTDEHGVAWDDPTISAPWRNLEPSLSERDRSNPKLEWETIDPFS